MKIQKRFVKSATKRFPVLAYCLMISDIGCIGSAKKCSIGTALNVGRIILGCSLKILGLGLEACFCIGTALVCNLKYVLQWCSERISHSLFISLFLPPLPLIQATNSILLNTRHCTFPCLKSLTVQRKKVDC